MELKRQVLSRIPHPEIHLPRVTLGGESRHDPEAEVKLSDAQPRRSHSQPATPAPITEGPPPARHRRQIDRLGR